MNILVTGCNGQLGNELRVSVQNGSQHKFFFTDVFVPDDYPCPAYLLDITQAEDVFSFVNEHRIDLIVNCAAYTNVDEAEKDKERARVLNALAVENLAKTKKKIIHVSTDYVFSGESHVPLTETDTPNPNTVYGATKLEGENLLLSEASDAIIFRTAWLYSSFGKNFVKTMLRLGRERDSLSVVFDQVGSPTYARDLADAILVAINFPIWESGIYHFSNEGVCSWYDFTLDIFRLKNIKTQVKPILSKEYCYATPRPHYSVLDKTKIKNTFHLNISHWRDSLERCLNLL